MKIEPKYFRTNNTQTKCKPNTLRTSNTIARAVAIGLGLGSQAWVGGPQSESLGPNCAGVRFESQVSKKETQSCPTVIRITIRENFICRGTQKRYLERERERYRCVIYASQIPPRPLEACGSPGAPSRIEGKVVRPETSSSPGSNESPANLKSTLGEMIWGSPRVDQA